jgi:hypothetical protein
MPELLGYLIPSEMSLSYFLTSHYEGKLILRKRE